jgi:uncharacterized phage-associated protein
MTIQDACDYIIVKVRAGDESLSLLKLQKLLYYVQAWYLAFHSSTLFDGKFQAWVHGPVNRQIYDRFSATKSLYSEVSKSDISEDFDPDKIPTKSRNHIDAVLDVYAKYTGAQLEALTHEESPWVNARKGYSASARCENEISETAMQKYYSARLP